MDSLQQDAEFAAMVGELEADAVKQRQWYEANKDRPIEELLDAMV